MTEDIRRKGVVDSLKFEVNIAAKVITGEVEIEAPPEKLWSLLTPTDEIVTWYDECDSITRHSPQATLRVGSTFQLTGGGKSSWCRVTLMAFRWQPPHGVLLPVKVGLPIRIRHSSANSIV